MLRARPYREWRAGRIHRASAGAVALACSVAAAAPADLDRAVYERAAQFLPSNQESLILNATVRPHWRAGPFDRFTYRHELGDGRAEFVEVDAATGRRRPAFDHARVAAGLAAAGVANVAADRLPFRDYDEAGAAEIRFAASGKEWQCRTNAVACHAAMAPAGDPSVVASPDGRQLAFIRDGNLWIRASDGSGEFALTTDAVPHFAYGATPEANIVTAPLRLAGRPEPPAVLWSPDSSRLFVQKLDERTVREVTLVQSVPDGTEHRARAHTWRYAMPNDPAIPLAESWLFDVRARSGRRLAIDPVATVFQTSVESREAWWSPDSRRLNLLVRSRYYKTMALYAVDAATGAARRVVEESSRTFLEPAALGERPMAYVLRSGELLWFSEREGHGQLYVYDDASGALKRRLTSGSWSVRNVLAVDERRGFVYVAGVDREEASDPYFRSVYRIDIQSGRRTTLTPEDADHAVLSSQAEGLGIPPRELVRDPDASQGFSPSMRYFIDTYARTDLPARTVLRRADGVRVAELEQADVTRLAALGLTTPERFSVLAADGKTRIYGNLLRPTHFDGSARYPVLDSIYPGPQHRRVTPSFVSAVFDPMDAQAYAELGFVVVTLDGRGTPGRSKAFLDESYGRLGEAGNLEDHVAAIRELGRRYPYLDLDRVGIFGTSGGGYAALHALLTYPDFFKAAVSDAGNHDQRGYLAVWGETYNGPDDGQNYLAASNVPLVGNLRGHLLLIHGGMDFNVLPDHTMQVVDALIAHNKDFEFLVVPKAAHTTILAPGYAMRRSWDFVVRHLLGRNPPVDFEFPAPPAAH
ncbi:MAG: DPP IV N-terminal domain-containing protein [Proteobacteria bacterium]|nr:DPP IV N-terminal domain-containing protein [Pseudomonadota bacterium]